MTTRRPVKINSQTLKEQKRAERSTAGCFCVYPRKSAADANAEMDIPQPATFHRSGSYPTKWAVRHDMTRREYRVELLGLVKG
ncbi:MAG TPA: hypothetical protein VGQ52_17925 [Gemmatimonadaceae bacterium]|nr:hypothetical protein [Gemmatimonadaceae bacterium]